MLVYQFLVAVNISQIKNTASLGMKKIIRNTDLRDAYANNQQSFLFLFFFHLIGIVDTSNSNRTLQPKTAFSQTEINVI